ncbi:MAG TPA: pitrilysin family protein [Rudaea sp.]|jgi:predicted Zn-dependent peptidase|nr:pitrilysin family protein [Rudaea sp.]
MSFRSTVVTPIALALTLLCTAVSAENAAPATAKFDTVDLSFEKFQLENGLTVVVHEDHKAPVVHVAVWYHIGSADEPAGKTGFAHLFEHLMFSGSENHKTGYFKPFEQVGATDQNGTTWNDRTNYFQTVPTSALDLALWMESDRMGHLLGAIGQKELDTQRGVVQNEKRQDENQPYGRVEENIQVNAFPVNHPYHHDTIGSMKDLNDASLADVKKWFTDHYGSANTTLVLVGDITPAIAREKAEKYFGDIPAGPPVARQQPWVFPRKDSTRGEMVDQVAQVRVYREWNVPQLGDTDLQQLSLAAAVLGGGKTSRLYERLVYKDKIADDVEVGIERFALASMFQLQVDVKKGVDPARVEAAIADEWSKFLKDGPTQDEIDRARTRSHAGFIRGVEKVASQARILAEGQVYRDDPVAYKKDFAALDAATPASVLASAQKWVSKGDYTLTVKPGTPDPTKDEAEAEGLAASPGEPKAVLPEKRVYKTVKSDVDRSKGVPDVASFPDLNFPTLQRGKLKNGIEVVLAERHAIPVVQMKIDFSGGYAADHGRKLGTASFTTAMLDEGTKDLDSLEIARRRDRLGAILATGCDLDTCGASLNTLKSQITASLALFADIVRNPAFRDDDVSRIRGQWLAGIAQEKTEPTGMALRTLPPLIYGKNNPYAIPFTGSGTEAAIKSLTTADMRKFMIDFIRPDNAKIIVAGDTTLAEIVPQLDAAFGDWKAPASKAVKIDVAKVKAPAKPAIYLLDRPGSQQSVIIAGVVAPSTMAPNNLEISTMTQAFGGLFSSRLNMNLREDKHWAYGAFSFSPNAIGQRLFVMYAPVQTDKTAPAAEEVLKEARGVIGDHPLTDEEIAKVKNGDMRALPGQYESTAAVLGAVQSIVTYHRPDDYVQTFKHRVEAQKDADIQAAAKEIVQPDELTWVIVGDRKQIEQPMRALNLGAVQVLDADGNVVH